MPRLDNDFEKNFDRALKILPVLWVAGALMSLAVTGVVIWAIVMLVQHFMG